MELKMAGEIMIPLEKYPHILDNATLREAIIAMDKAAIVTEGRVTAPRVVLVFNLADQLLGQVRRRDILRGLEPGFLERHQIKSRHATFDIKADPNLSILSYDSMVKGIQEKAGHPVSGVMKPIPATVDYHDHLMRVINVMVEYDSSHLPVLRDGRVCGLVRSVDVMHELAQSILK
jgi:CBS domain-containing protein